MTSKQLTVGLVILGALLAVAAALVLAVQAGGFLGSGEEIPTAVVERRDFVRRVSAEGVLRSARSTQLTVPPQAPRSLRIAWMAPEGTPLEAGDLVMQFDPTELEKTLEDSQADLSTNRIEEQKERVETEAEIENLERDRQIAERELEDARRFRSEDEEIYSRVEIIESGIDQELAETRLRQAEASRDRERVLSRAELEILAIQRRQIENELSQAEQGLAALEVRAPHDGILVYKRDFRGNKPQVGQNVFAGQPLAEIPSLAIMEAEVYVLEADAGGLAAGQPARMTLESVPGRTFGARVARVDALAKPRIRASPVQYFAVVLELDATDPEIMKPGQRVEAELVLQELEEVLVVPRQAIFERDDRRVVLRQEGGDFEPVPIQIAASGLGKVAVVPAGEPLPPGAQPLGAPPGARGPGGPGGPGGPRAMGGAIRFPGGQPPAGLDVSALRQRLGGAGAPDGDSGDPGESSGPGEEGAPGERPFEARPREGRSGSPDRPGGRRGERSAGSPEAGSPEARSPEASEAPIGTTSAPAEPSEAREAGPRLEAGDRVALRDPEGRAEAPETEPAPAAPSPPPGGRGRRRG